jgi:hypothetical protein
VAVATKIVRARAIANSPKKAEAWQADLRTIAYRRYLDKWHKRAIARHWGTD